MILAEWIATIIQIIALLIIIIRILRLPEGIRRSMRSVFFLFGSISFLVSNCYWMVYDILIPDARMPFAPNEFGEAAMYLLFGSALATIIPRERKTFNKEVICTSLFTAANILLWIGWSGEWLQDILGGLAFGYFLCMAVLGLKQKEAFSAKDWRILGFGSIVVIILLTADLFAGAVTGRQFETGYYILMTAIGVFFVVKVVRAFKRKKDAGTLMVLSFAGFAWSAFCLYMSEGFWYQLAMYAGTAMLLLTLAAVEKEVRES